MWIENVWEGAPKIFENLVVMVQNLPLGVSKYPHIGIPTAVAPTTKHINPSTATHVEYKDFTSAISQIKHFIRMHLEKNQMKLMQFFPQTKH